MRRLMSAAVLVMVCTLVAVGFAPHTARAQEVVELECGLDGNDAASVEVEVGNVIAEVSVKCVDSWAAIIFAEVGDDGGGVALFIHAAADLSNGEPAEDEACFLGFFGPFGGFSTTTKYESKCSNPNESAEFEIKFKANGSPS
jgi:hypothetical protein